MVNYLLHLSQIFTALSCAIQPCPFQQSMLSYFDIPRFALPCQACSTVCCRARPKENESSHGVTGKWTFMALRLHLASMGVCPVLQFHPTIATPKREEVYSKIEVLTQTQSRHIAGLIEPVPRGILALKIEVLHLCMDKMVCNVRYDIR